MSRASYSNNEVGSRNGTGYKNRISAKKRDKDKDLRTHMSSRYGCKDKEDEESALWIHRLKSGWFEDRARQTLSVRKERMIEEYENAEELKYRDGMSTERRKERIKGHINAVDDEIEYYDKTFRSRYNNDDKKVNDARRRFKENDRRKVMYGNFSNREDIVTIKKMDTEMDLFRDQILESIQYMDSRLDSFENTTDINIAETVEDGSPPLESSGDLSTFMSVTGFMVDEEKYWDFRDMDNYVYEIDDDYLNEFYFAIELRDISIQADIDFTVVKREAETLRQIRDKYLSHEDLLKEIILVNHIRNGTSIRCLDFNFRDSLVPKYSIVFLSSGSGKSSLVSRYGDLFVDGDLLNPFKSDEYIGRVNKSYLDAYPEDWDRLNAYHRDRIWSHRKELVGKILMIQHPDLVPYDILKESKILFLFRSDRTGIRMNQLNTESLLKYLAELKKGLRTLDSIHGYCTVVSRYDNMIFEIIRYFKLRFRFRIKYKYKYRPHVRKPPLDW